jgi:hypothetical protein
MISREEHLKQVNRFHDTLEKVDNEIQEKIKSGDVSTLELYSNYFILSAMIWPLVDDSIEKIKDRLDRFDIYHE